MGNYIQIEIGGKFRGWKVNQMTIEIWSKMLNETAFASTSNYAAVYGGLVANCYVKQEEPDFTYEQVCDWVDDLNTSANGEAILNQIKVAFEESQYYIRIIEKLNTELKTLQAVKDDKKKVKKR